MNSPETKTPAEQTGMGFKKNNNLNLKIKKCILSYKREAIIESSRTSFGLLGNVSVFI